MIHFITYGDNGFVETKKRLVKQAESIGWFDSITAYGPEDLDEDFKEKFKSVLELPSRKSEGWRHSNLCGCGVLYKP